MILDTNQCETQTFSTMKKLILGLSLILLSVATWAQPAQQQNRQPRFDPQKFQQMMEFELAKAAELTADEAKAFFPLYNELRKKQRDMGMQIYQLKANAPTDSKGAATAVNKINTLKVEMAELEQEYYKRIMKVVPANKIIKVMRAEDNFHRRMVQNNRGRQTGKPSRQFQHPQR